MKQHINYKFNSVSTPSLSLTEVFDQNQLCIFLKFLNQPLCVRFFEVFNEEEEEEEED